MKTPRIHVREQPNKNQFNPPKFKNLGKTTGAHLNVSMSIPNLAMKNGEKTSVSVWNYLRVEFKILSNI